MNCPYCHREDTQVTDSRITATGDAIKRRRQCKHCKRRFTTYERIERIGLTVVKKDNTRVPYSRDKLQKGIAVACTKRPVPADRIEEAVNEIESQLFGLGTSEVSTTAVGELVMQKLRELDEVAYIRFASVYRNFADLEEMREEMEGLTGSVQPVDMLHAPGSIEPASKERKSRSKSAH
jgi:transcriptional repressor NrdR